ncbi:MAG: nitrate reductase [Bryobacterales bacterium]|nr:nitrate reductase [Bryobacterales bacterium]
MNPFRLLGLDNLSEQYAYTDDPVLGHTSAARASEKWVKTTCGYCSVGCGMEVGVRDNKAVAVRGWEGHPVSFGKLCPKGLSEHHTLSAPNRAQYPLLRKNGNLVRVSWTEALHALVENFQRSQAKHGQESLGVISTGQLLTEEFYTLGKLIQLGFGTPNYDGNTTLCMASAVSGYKLTFGSDGPPGNYEDLRTADFVLLIGANIADNHPILVQHLGLNSHKYLAVVDPRVSKTAMLADLHLPIRPRGDIALLNAMAHVILRDGLANHAYIAAHTRGIQALQPHLEKYTPEFAAAIAGLKPQQIVDLAHRYAKAKASFIAWTMGVNHSTQGAETVNAINNLALLTGHIGRPGAAPFSITGQCNAMGSREISYTSSAPGYRKFESEADRAELAALWNVDVNRLPAQRGRAYPDIINAAVNGEIKSLWVIATNPVVSYPNQSQLRAAFANLDFLVVQDGYHPNPTSELAHLVLPAAVWGEKEGVYTNSERRVGKVNIAVRPPAEARPDFDIFLAVAEKLGCREELFPGWSTPADAFEEIKLVTRGRLCDYSGMTYKAMEIHGGLQWPFPEGTSPAEPSRLYADGAFPAEDGKAALIPVSWQPFPDQPGKGFPFVLNTGRTVEHWHTRTKTAQVALLERMSPNAWLEMNPGDARRLGFKNHDSVSLVSRRGQVHNIELRLTEIIAPGQLFMPFHFVETNVNEVTQDAFDPISREPNYKQCAVRVERSSNPHF